MIFTQQILDILPSFASDRLGNELMTLMVRG